MTLSWLDVYFTVLPLSDTFIAAFYYLVMMRGPAWACRKDVALVFYNLYDLLIILKIILIFPNLGIVIRLSVALIFSPFVQYLKLHCVS